MAAEPFRAHRSAHDRSAASAEDHKTVSRLACPPFPLLSVSQNMRTALLWVGVLILAGGAASAAQTADKKQPACALLTTSEVVTAVGGTGRSQETDTVIPSGPSKGETMHGCMWSADNQGMVTIPCFARFKARSAKLAWRRSEGPSKGSKAAAGLKRARHFPARSVR